MRHIIGAGAALVLLAGCGGSGNFNWFGGGNSTPEQLVTIDPNAVRDPRPVIEEVTDVVVERVAGGAIVRARGRVAATGWYNADLVSEPSRSGPGVLGFSFRATAPSVPVRPAGPNSRQIVAARFVSDAALIGRSQIQVASRTNVRTASP